MKQAFVRLLGMHQAFWAYDPRYRRAWLIWPHGVSIPVLALILLAGDAMPPAAPWVKPVAPPAPTPNPEFQLCTSESADIRQRGEACDRLIASGRLSGIQLGNAYFGRGRMRATAQDIDAAIADYSEAVRLNPAGAAGSYHNRGLLLLNAKNDLASAERDFSKVIEIEASRNPRALPFAGRAEVRRRQGRLTEAQADIARAVELEKSNVFVREVRDKIEADLRLADGSGSARPEPQTPDLALCNNTSADPKTRGEACDRLIAFGRLGGNQLAEAYVGRAWMHFQANRADAAIADYSEAIRLNPAHTTAYQNRGLSYLDKNDPAAADRDFTKVIELTSANKPDARAFAARAEARRRLGRLAEAQADIARALELDKNSSYFQKVRDSIQADIKRPAEDETTTLRKRASASLDQRDYQAVIAGFTQLIRGGSREFSDYQNRGIAYQANRQPDLALADFTQAISLPGHGWQAHYRRAQILADRNQGDDAVRDLDEAIRDHAGKDADIFWLRGRIHLQKQAYGLALDDFDRLVEIAPDYADGYVLRGLTLAASERKEMESCRNRPPTQSNRMIVGGPCTRPFTFNDALGEFKTAIAKKPDLAGAHAGIGQIMFWLDRPQDAMQAYSTAIKHAPGMAGYYNERGIAYIRLNMRNLALADFNEAVRLEPNLKEAWSNRGESHEREHQRQQAIEDYRRALMIDPQFAPALEGLRRLGARP